MICPNCKNETLDQDPCPNCGLGKVEALQASADRLRSEGKYLQAMAVLERCLELDPSDPKVRRAAALCLCHTALSSREGNLFEKARASMGAALESDWEWREGHEARLHLFHRFGRLEDLLVEYQTKDPAPGTIGAEMERIIRLAQEFSASPPSVATGLPDSADWKTWLRLFPLTVGIPLLAWGGLELSKALQDRGGQGQLYSFLTLMTVGAGILLLALQILKILKGPKTARKRSGVHP